MTTQRSALPGRARTAETTVVCWWMKREREEERARARTEGGRQKRESIKKQSRVYAVQYIYVYMYIYKVNTLHTGPRQIEDALSRSREGAVRDYWQRAAAATGRGQLSRDVRHPWWRFACEQDGTTSGFLPRG